jgi:type I restriction enzyme M protein
MLTADDVDRRRKRLVELQGIIRSARDVMRMDAGLSSELDRVPQLAWLMFLKAFDAVEERQEQSDTTFRRAIDGQYRWKIWVERAPHQRDDRVLQFVNDDLLPHLRSLSGNTPDDSRTVIGNVFREIQNQMRSGGLLRQLILKIDEIDFTSADDRHFMAFIYEGLLKDVRDAAGTAGEFYTPRPVIKFMVNSSYLRPDSTVADPACGTGGFLVESFLNMSGRSDATDGPSFSGNILGIEKKPLPFLLGTMNLLLHGMRPSMLGRQNALSESTRDALAGRVDAIVTNPPFGGEEEPAIYKSFSEEYRSRETSWLFLVSAMDALAQGGQCAIVVPNGVLFDRGVGYNVKRLFESHFNLHTIVRLPEGVFSPYTKIPTNLLFFERGRTEVVWFYRVPVGGGGKSYTKKRPMKDEDFKECFEWWGGPGRVGRRATDCAWSVRVEELIARQWNLDLVHPLHGTRSYGASTDLLAKARERAVEVESIASLLLADEGEE